MEWGQRLIGLSALEYALSDEESESVRRKNVRCNAVDADPKNQQQNDDPDRDGPTLRSRILAIVHPGVISGRSLLGSHRSFLRGCLG
jgi:hypothetical protein